MSTKRCFKCNDDLPLDEFYRHPRMADGRLNKCKGCTRKDVNANRAVNLDYYRGYDRDRSMVSHRVEARHTYATTNRGRQAHARATTRWNKRNPHKRSAHSAVQSAKRSGVLVANRCRDCDSADTQAHHPDYTKPLAVVWLCAVHHAAEHRRSHDIGAADVY
jgi:hypothetical protein